MSKVADWMREKYVEPQERKFYVEHGRWPSVLEERVMWDRAFKLAEWGQKIEQLDLD